MQPSTATLSGGGREWMVEAYGCDPIRLGDIAALQVLFHAAITELGLHPVGDAQWHRFPAPGGVTGMLMLAESHLTVHTFPEHASLCVNLFCCTPRPEWNWELRLAHFVGAQQVRVRSCERPYAAHPADAVTPTHTAQSPESVFVTVAEDGT